MVLINIKKYFGHEIIIALQINYGYKTNR